MYKCGWNGCEKAYGTLNHLNAHVTMQSHGSKRTPEGTTFLIPFFLERVTREIWAALLVYEGLGARNIARVALGLVVPLSTKRPRASDHARIPKSMSKPSATLAFPSARDEPCI